MFRALPLPLRFPQFCVFIPLLLVSSIARGQVNVGTPKFNTFGGGPFDTLNLGNLNTHFVIPVLQKAGRGLSFNYSLSYDSSIWQPGTSWTPIATNAWGWTNSMSGGGEVTNHQTVDQEPCFQGGAQKTETTITTTSFRYIDAVGTVHPFFGIAIHKSGCTVQNTGFGPRAASDGSGYQITVDGSGDVLSLTAANGSQINATFGFNAITDANGNEITSSTASGKTTYTDTLGTQALVVSGSGTPTSPITLQYTGPGGTSPEVTIQYTSYTVATHFGFSTIHEYGPLANSLVSSIQLPDGSSYSFTYEQTPAAAACTPISGTFSSYCITGRIASVTLPTGGVLTYVYSGGTNNTGIFADGSTAGLKRILANSTTCTVNSTTAPCWQYARSLVSGTPGTGSTWTTTLADPNGNDTVLNFAEDAATGGSTVPTFSLYETQRKSYQGNTSGTLLATTITCYNTNYAGCSTATVTSPITQKDVYSQLPNSNIRLSQVVYNSSGLVTDDKEYDYGVTMGAAPTAANRIKEIAIGYAVLGGAITNKPNGITIYDWTSGSAVALSSIAYSYDLGTITATSGTPQHVAVNGARGNLTNITSAMGHALTQQFSYYDTGTPNVITDMNAAQTTYVYGTGSCGNSFPTAIDEALSLSRTMVWDCNGGINTQVTDENGKIQSSTYTDPDFWRPATVTDQINNQTVYSYFGQTAIETALQNFNSGHSASDHRSTIDGFGRLILSQALQGPGLSTYDTVETDYNNVGEVQRTTMPFSAAAGGSSSTAPGKTKTYDALGRVLTDTDNDGGQVSFTYTNNDVLRRVSGTQTFEKQFEYDGLGRLASVCEISTTLPGVGSCGQGVSQTGYLTKYTYDALEHLLTVTQNAQAAAASQQTRTFTYDPLGRLASESNPETGNNGVNGTITYSYDFVSPCGDGNNYSSQGDLVEKKDNAGNTTCYAYDALHRLVQAGNATISGATIRKFFYDSENSYPTGVTVLNGKTRAVEAQTLTTTNSIITDEFFSYDGRGELTDLYESTPHSGGFYHTTAAYWPTGATETLSGIPGVPTLNYGASGTGLDPEGRVMQVTASSGTNPVSSVTYSSSSTTNFLGALTNVIYGSADNDSFTYDSNTGRMLTYGFHVNGKLDGGTLTWNSNGTLSQLVINDQITSTGDSQTCTYSHDDLQRASGASCGTHWSQTFTYDAFGNITKSGSLSFAPNYVFSNSATTNQFFSIPGVSVRYDSNGNLLTDNLNTYTWDPNWGSAASVNAINLIYDALGRVVEQQNGSSSTQILYSPIGKTALMNGQTLTKAFLHLPGGGTAIYNSSGLAYYRHSDWLGSSRLTSTQTRGLFSSMAYAPFGEQYALDGTADASFTGQNSDTVSSLYDFTFRKHSPSQGRWISPDLAGVAAVDPGNPQTWNRYAYVGNTPLNAVDPLGLDDGDDNQPLLPPPDDPGLPPIDAPFCDPTDPFCNGGPCDAEFGPCNPGPIGEPADPRPPISGGGGTGILPGENSINFPIGSGNPLEDLWQGLNLPSFPCASQFGPWCDPSKLPDPSTLDRYHDNDGYYDCAHNPYPSQPCYEGITQKDITVFNDVLSDLWKWFRGNPDSKCAAYRAVDDACNVSYMACTSESPTPAGYLKCTAAAIACWKANAASNPGCQ